MPGLPLLSATAGRHDHEASQQFELFSSGASRLQKSGGAGNPIRFSLLVTAGIIVSYNRHNYLTDGSLAVLSPVGRNGVGADSRPPKKEARISAGLQYQHSM
jgi:hypothetical protein